MRQVLALLGVVALGTAFLSACGGGSADRPEAGARKAACNNSPNFASASRPAALPPEPVEDLLPKAWFVVEAQVARVLYQGEKPEHDTRRGVAGPLPPDRCQIVQLEVTNLVIGEDPGSSVTVVKPLAPYLLRDGQNTTDLAFVVQAGDPFPIILGRYGPYPLSDVQAALRNGQ